MVNKTWIWLIIGVGAAASGLAIYMSMRQKGQQNLRRLKERPREQKLEELAIP
ncbi:MAG TPA: hypothetical protein VFJ51_10045 [Nitrososphaeraceae archaeon]|nr:hypothetical protein [Nitrososphaeraceae archaeon]